MSENPLLVLDMGTGTCKGAKSEASWPLQGLVFSHANDSWSAGVHSILLGRNQTPAKFIVDGLGAHRNILKNPVAKRDRDAWLDHGALFAVRQGTYSTHYVLEQWWLRYHSSSVTLIALGGLIRMAGNTTPTQHSFPALV